MNSSVVSFINRRNPVKACRIIFILVLLSLNLSCSPRPAKQASQADITRYQYTQLHLGVQVRIVLYAEKEERARAAATAAYRRIAELEDIFSTYRAHSELSQLPERAYTGPAEVSEDLFFLLQQSTLLSQRTGGAFDITVGPFIELWRHARNSLQLPELMALQDARNRVGWNLLTLDDTTRQVQLLKPGMKLSMDGIAKGFILDRALLVLEKYGITSALIEAGGDIVVSGPPAGSKGWKINIADASQTSEIVQRANELTNSAISTSGDTEQFVLIDGLRYSHVIDPATGLGTTHRTMATVIARRGYISDGYATAFTVLSPSSRDSLLQGNDSLLVFIRTIE